MIIGVDASRALTGQRTGTENYSWQIIRGLLSLPQAQDHAWRLYLPAPPPDRLLAGLPVGVDVQAVILSGQRLWTHRRLAGEMLRRPPDRLFVPAHVLPCLPPRLLPASVVTVHDLGYRHFPQAHPTGHRLYLDLSTRWNCWASRALIAVSAFTAGQITQTYGTAPSKIRVIYEAGAGDWGLGTGDQGSGIGDWGLGTGEDAPRTTDHAPRTTHPITQSPNHPVTQSPYALYLGTLQPRKNLVRLIRAYAMLCRVGWPGWDLVVAGKVGWLAEDLPGLAYALGVQEYVHFPGYVAEEQVADLYRHALFFAFPSLFEGFGLPVLEAQQMGVPVMTSNNSALPEIGGEGALYVDPEDTEALAQAMLRLSHDEALRQQLIAAGYENLKRFSWETAAQQTLEVILAAGKERG